MPLHVPLSGYVAAVAHVYAAEGCTVVLICAAGVSKSEAIREVVDPAAIPKEFRLQRAIIKAARDVVPPGDHVGKRVWIGQIEVEGLVLDSRRGAIQEVTQKLGSQT